MPDTEETVDAREHQVPDLDGAARAALVVLNPHMYYNPRGIYEPEIIPSGHWITVEMAVRSWGWEEVEKIPEVRLLLERMNLVLQIAREEPVG